jgi:DNA-binding IclR family transcriptional regulator
LAQSIERAITLIELAAKHPLTLTEAAKALDVHKTTALRILQTLKARRLVRSTGDGAYALGSGLIELAQVALGAIDLRQIASQRIRELQRLTGHTVHLAQLIGDEIIYVDKVDSAALEGVQIQSRIGRPVSLYASGVGKVILAYRTQEERERLLAGVKLVQHTPTTFATREVLEGELSRIRDRGWGMDDGELYSVVTCIAVPIRDAGGEVIAALSVTAMKAAPPISQLVEQLPLLLGTAARISADMGYVAPQPGL